MAKSCHNMTCQRYLFLLTRYMIRAITMILSFLSSLLTSIGNIVVFAYSLLFRRRVYFEKCNMTVFYNDDAIGEGAYSVVFKGASAADFHKTYALKRILTQSEEAEEMVMTEVQAFQQFQHRNILPLLDLARQQQGRLRTAFLLFPYMNKGSLRDHLNMVLEGQTPQPPLLTVLRNFADVCGAFNVLHDHHPSYIHQDVKPENVLIDEHNRPLLTDFGSVRLANVDIKSRNDSIRIAEEAAQYCTISYRPPELFDPKTGDQLDSRTDVWGIGCLLFAWWFGYSPFECEFTSTGVRVVACSSLRVLSPIATKPQPTREDAIVQILVQWILLQDIVQRPFTRDIIVKTNEIIQTCNQTDGQLPV